MFSDPHHDHIVHNIDNQNHLIACFEDAMMNNLDIENCFGNHGHEVAVWAGGHHDGHCCQTLVIKQIFGGIIICTRSIWFIKLGITSEIVQPLKE